MINVNLMNTYSALPTTSTPDKQDTFSDNGSRNVTVLSNCKVLYVEDNIFNQALAKQLFHKIGCDLEIACNGYQALEMIIKERFDLIFMDINMPGLDGFETTAIIREKLRLKVPILALTNSDTDEDIRMSKSVGMSDYLIKPLDEKQLTQSIIRWKKESIDARKFIKA